MFCQFFFIGDAIIRARAALGLKGEAEAVASSGITRVKDPVQHYTDPIILIFFFNLIHIVKNSSILDSGPG